MQLTIIITKTNEKQMYMLHTVHLRLHVWHADFQQPLTVVLQVNNQGAQESESNALGYLAWGHILLHCNCGKHTQPQNSRLTHLMTTL